MGLFKRNKVNTMEPTVVCENWKGDQLKSIYQVIDKRTHGDVNKALVPYWCAGLCFFVSLAILIVLSASLVIVYFAPRPGLFTESCFRRSCVKDLNLKCIDGTCQCSTGYFYTAKCIPKKEFNEKCHLDSYCADEKNMVCRDGVCKCDETKYWDGKKCISKNTISKACASDEQCLDKSILFCSTTTGKCTCAANRFWDSSISACVPKRTINEVCDGQKLCLETQNLVCKNGTCQCNSTDYWNSKFSICLSKFTENQTCSSTPQCISPMNCTSNSMCQCQDKAYHDISTLSCIPQKTHLENCAVEFNCRVDKYLDCIAGKCRCVAYYPEWSIERDMCIMPLTYTQPCLYQSDCDASLSLVCNTGSNCTCPTPLTSGFCDCVRIANSEFYWDDSSCTPAKPYNDACNANHECKTLTENTLCISSKCQCETYFYFNHGNQICQNQVLNNDSCPQTDECRSDLGLLCVSGTCQCNTATQFWNGTQCINYYTYNNETCSNDTECSGLLVCQTSGISCDCPMTIVNNICDCPARVYGTEYYWDSNDCVLAKIFNESCTSDYECQTVTERTQCIGSICGCAPFNYFYYGNRTCENQVLDGEACTQNDGCRSDLGLACVSGLCQCDTSTYFWNGAQCVYYYTYDSETCTSDSECKDLLVCKLGSGSSCSCPTAIADNKCDCPLGVYGTEYYWDGFDCVSAKVYNSSCGENYECQAFTEQTICSGSLCTCATYSYFYFGNRTCQSKVLDGESCPQTDECRVDLGLSCVSGTCQCNTATQFWNGTRCVNYYTYNSETCLNDNECNGLLVCKLSGSSCTCPTSIVNGKCDCPVRVYGTEYYWDGSNCVAAKVLNASCTQNYECKTVTENTICSASICQCATFFYFYVANRTCQSQQLNGGSCPQGNECRNDLGLSCVSGTCQCSTATQFWNGTRCINYYSYNSETCLNDNECKGILVCKVSGSSCTCPTSIVNGKCDCPLGVYGTEYYWDGSNCVSAKVYNASCGANYECQAVTEKTVCSGSRCICATHSYFYFGNRTCQNQGLNGISCPQSDECRTDLGLSCVSGTCQCSAATQFWNGTRCVNYYTYNSETCLNDNECKGLLVCKLSGSSCTCPTSIVNGKCDCPVRVYGTEYYWDGSNCVSAKVLNTSCTQNYECKTVTENTICSASICQCATFFYFYVANRTCQSQQLNGGSCPQGNECRVDLGLSCVSGSCQCSTVTQFWNGTRCVNYYTYNSETCLNDNECKGLLVCKLSGSSCTCPTSIVNSKCDCPLGVYGTEYYWDGSDCVLAKVYNSSCGANYECKAVTEKTICSSSRCICAIYQYFYFTNRTCQSQVQNGIFCPQTDECRTDLGLSCVSGTCQCSAATQFWNGTRCVNYYTYNSETCLNDNECNGLLVCKLSGSSCTCPTSIVNGKCDCPVRVYGTEYYWSGSDCVAAKVLNASCTQNYECKTVTENTICSASICQCATFFYFYAANRTCQSQQINGGSCQQGNECRVDLGLSCVAGSCQCSTATQFWNGTRCINYYTYNSETCLNDNECKGLLVCKVSGSSCTCPTSIVNGKCDCPVRVYGTEYYWDGSNCVSAKVLNTSCTQNYECKTVTENTICSASICQCATFFYFYVANRTCQSQQLNGGSCPQGNECRNDLGLLCVSGKCQCNAITQFWNGTRCVNFYTYNSEACTNDTECKGQLVCKKTGLSCSCPTSVANNKCDCPVPVSGAEYYWNGSDCVLASAYGQTCTANYACQTLKQKTYCNSGVCDCNNGAFNGTMCIFCKTNWKHINGLCYFVNSANGMNPGGAVATSANIQSVCDNTAAARMAKINDNLLISWLFTEIPDAKSGDKFFIDAFQISGTNYKSKDLTWTVPDKWCSAAGKDDCTIYKRGNTVADYCFEEHKCDQHGHWTICEYDLI